MEAVEFDREPHSVKPTKICEQDLRLPGTDATSAQGQDALNWAGLMWPIATVQDSFTVDSL